MTSKVITHQLIVDPICFPIKEKKRKYFFQTSEEIKLEIKRLLGIDYIWELTYPMWLAKHVVVNKANGECIIFINITDINKACSKDSYPLPNIDLRIDLTSCYELIIFMDSYYTYH